MRFFILITHGAYRIFYGLMHVFDQSQSGVHRSDYWGGDDTPISRERNYMSSKRQKRWRRKRSKREEMQRQNSNEPP